MPKNRSKSSDSSSSSSSISSNEKPKNKVVSPPKNVENNDFQYFLLVSGLTKNVNIDHLKEIFANFGKIKNIEFPF